MGFLVSKEREDEESKDGNTISERDQILDKPYQDTD
jgi:hypothetical protein